jgi:hypothetical protein
MPLSEMKRLRGQVSNTLKQYNDLDRSYVSMFGDLAGNGRTIGKFNSVVLEPTMTDSAQTRKVTVLEAVTKIGCRTTFGG